MDLRSAPAGAHGATGPTPRAPQGLVVLLWSPEGLTPGAPLAADQTKALAESLLTMAQQLLAAQDGATPALTAARLLQAHGAQMPATAGKPLRSGPFQIESEHGLVRWRGPNGWVALELTEVERRLMRQLLQAAGRACSRLDIAQGLWGGDVHHLRTVDQCVRRLRTSLLQAGVPDCIRTVRGVGYRIESELAAARGATPSRLPARA